MESKSAVEQNKDSCLQELHKFLKKNNLDVFDSFEHKSEPNVGQFWFTHEDGKCFGKELYIIDYENDVYIDCDDGLKSISVDKANSKKYPFIALCINVKCNNFDTKFISDDGVCYENGVLKLLLYKTHHQFCDDDKKYFLSEDEKNKQHYDALWNDCLINMCKIFILEKKDNIQTNVITILEKIFKCLHKTNPEEKKLIWYYKDDFICENGDLLNLFNQSVEENILVVTKFVVPFALYLMDFIYNAVDLDEYDNFINQSAKSVDHEILNTIFRCEISKFISDPNVNQMVSLSDQMGIDSDEDHDSDEGFDQGASFFGQCQPKEDVLYKLIQGFFKNKMNTLLCEIHEFKKKLIDKRVDSIIDSGSLCAHKASVFSLEEVDYVRINPISYYDYEFSMYGQKISSKKLQINTQRDLYLKLQLDDLSSGIALFFIKIFVDSFIDIKNDKFVKLNSSSSEIASNATLVSDVSIDTNEPVYQQPVDHNMLFSDVNNDMQFSDTSLSDVDFEGLQLISKNT